MKFLTEEQLERLVQILDEEKKSEKRTTLTSIAEATECSLRSLQHNLFTGKFPTGLAYLVCEYLDINLLYITKGQEPIYKNWKKAFSEPKESSYKPVDAVADKKAIA
ncbi:hypothetical protein J4234_03770 [Candidatus Woesearchaeota archaeon]|nr:hypothetical protein [Candidatus Woesearchaeota archaeon]